MMAPLGTLAFLTTLWLLVLVGASVLEKSGAKIAAALKGELPQQPLAMFVAVRARSRTRIEQPMRASARWRDAA